MITEQLGDGTRRVRLLGKWQHCFSTREDSRQAWKWKLIYLRNGILAQNAMQVSTVLVVIGCLEGLPPSPLRTRSVPLVSKWSYQADCFSLCSYAMPFSSFLSFLEHGEPENKSLTLQRLRDSKESTQKYLIGLEFDCYHTLSLQNCNRQEWETQTSPSPQHYTSK